MIIITVRALRAFIALATAIILILPAIAVIPVFHLMSRYNRVYTSVGGFLIVWRAFDMLHASVLLEPTSHPSIVREEVYIKVYIHKY